MQILNQRQINQKIRRMAFEILEQHFEEPEIILAGINNRGMSLARMLLNELDKLTNMQLTLTQIRLSPANPLSRDIIIEMPLDEIASKVIIVVDDVVNTGRTLFYATKPLMDTLPKKIETAVLVERHHKSFPITVSYVGLSLHTTLMQEIDAQILENEEFGVFMQ
jgi:pyrimidine operon attenuation protein/uracil phosphoribosyltransferase